MKIAKCTDIKEFVDELHQINETLQKPNLMGHALGKRRSSASKEIELFLKNNRCFWENTLNPSVGIVINQIRKKIKKYSPEDQIIPLLEDASHQKLPNEIQAKIFSDIPSKKVRGISQIWRIEVFKQYLNFLTEEIPKYRDSLSQEIQSLLDQYNGQENAYQIYSKVYKITLDSLQNYPNFEQILQEASEDFEEDTPHWLLALIQWMNDYNLMAFSKKIFQDEFNLRNIESAESIRKWLEDNSNICEKIESLTLNNSELFDIPKEIEYFKNVQTIDLRENSITLFPQVFSTLKQLTELNLSFNKLALIPDFINQLSSLVSLDASHNMIHFVSSKITKLSSLKMLNLSANKITAVPQEFNQFSSLDILYLNDNQLDVVAKELCEIYSLTQLFLSENNLTELPKEIANLTNLNGLFLNNNNLQSLPVEIAELKNLKYLFYQRNPIKLENIPDEIKQLKNIIVMS